MWHLACCLPPFLCFAGSDFDPESIQTIGNRIWIGDEFGPYLLELNTKGQVRPEQPAGTPQGQGQACPEGRLH